MNLFKSLNSRWLCHFLRWKGAHVGSNFQVFGTIDLLLRDDADLCNLYIGDDVTFGGNLYLRMRKNGRIFISDRVRTGTEVWFVSANDELLKIGERTIIGSYSILNGGHGITIGTDCIFAAFVYINSSDHNYSRSEKIQNQGFSGSRITIGNDVWLGGQVFINKGVTIDDGSIIGAGAVVTRDIPSYCVAVGNPARVIKERE